MKNIFLYCPQKDIVSVSLHPEEQRRMEGGPEAVKEGWITVKELQPSNVKHVWFILTVTATSQR